MIEDRSPGYRDVVSELHRHSGTADVVGVTGSPGAGKSTLVDKVAATYRERGETVGVIAIDPSSPFTGGAVLGDRIRMASNAGDMDVFFRSMSTRGSLGGLSTATTDAVTALDAFGKDKIIVETVGAGQNGSTSSGRPTPSPSSSRRTRATTSRCSRPASWDRRPLRRQQGRPRRSRPDGGAAKRDDTPPDGRERARRPRYRRESLDAANRRDSGERRRRRRRLRRRRRGPPRLPRRVGPPRGESAFALRRRDTYPAPRDANALLADELEARGGVDHAVDRILEHETDPTRSWRA